MYMLLIILLMLSQDTAFAQNVHKIVLQVGRAPCIPGPCRWAGLCRRGVVVRERGRALGWGCPEQHPPPGIAAPPGWPPALCCPIQSINLLPPPALAAVPQSVPFYRERSTRTTLGSLLVVLLLRCAPAWLLNQQLGCPLFAAVAL